jgi:16S rRNA (uracil1498-N3)-methyltransferase
MSEKTIYLPKILIKNDKIELNSKYFINYIKNVLRYNLNDELNISNKNIIYETKILNISKKIIEFEVISKKNVEKFRKTKITLIQSLFSWPRLEWLFEKTIELGVDEIIFVQTERSKLKIDNWESKKERLDKIMYKALTQSHQARTIKIHEPIKLKDLKSIEGIKIIFDTKDENLTFTHTILNNSEQDVFIAIGPEGGFSDEEKAFFYNLGYKGYKMPLPILRAETASIAALVLISSFVK